MKIGRRTFLGGAMAFAAASAFVPASNASVVPTIYGDGVRDDTAGLQAFLDGRPFAVASDAFVAKDDVLDGGTFVISATLRLPDRLVTFQRCHIKMSGEASALNWLS